MTTRTYQTFDDLPEWARSCILKFRPADAQTWIFEPVPALENQSVIAVMNEGEEGVDKLRRYLNDLMGKFFSEG